jgi:hypothetical protein
LLVVEQDVQPSSAVPKVNESSKRDGTSQGSRLNKDRNVACIGAFADLQAEKK